MPVQRHDQPGQCRVLAPGAAPEGVADAGHRPPAARVRALAEGPRPVLVRCESASEAESTALVALYSWLGARVFTTDHPRAALQALDMVASVRGERPPAAARRGLA